MKEEIIAFHGNNARKIICVGVKAELLSHGTLVQYHSSLTK